MYSSDGFIKFFVILIFVSFVSLPGFSQGVFTWNGGSGNWTDSIRWFPNGVPGPVDTAIVNSGTIMLPANAAVGGLYHNGGILNGSGILTVDGNLSWKGGRIEGGGTVEVTAGATLKISGSSTKEINAGMLVNDGSAVWEDEGKIGFRNGAQLTNSANASFEIRGDARMDPLIPGAGSFTNSGALLKSAGSGTNVIDIDFISTGPITIDCGKVLLKKISSITEETVTLNNGSELEFNSGNHTLDDVYFEGDGKISIVNAPVIIQNSGAFFAEGINLEMIESNSILTVNDETEVKGTFDWNRGTIAGTSTLSVDGLLKITGTNARKLDGATLRNKDEAVWSGSGSIRMLNGAEFRNSSGSDLDIQTDVVVDYFEPGGGSFVNSGTLVKSGGNGLLLMKVSFENNETVNIQSGTLQLIRGGSADHATFNIDAGGLLDYNGGNQDLDDVTFTGNGQVSFSKNTITVVSGGAMLDTGITVTMSAGELACNGPLVNNGIFSWTNGIISGSEALASNGEFHFNTTNYVELIGQTINNHGLMVWQAPGTVKLKNSAKIANKAGATFDLQTDGLLDFVLAENGGSLFNAGTMTKSGGSGISYIDAEFTNTGTVNAHSGTLRFERGSNEISDGIFHTSAGKVLVLSERPFFLDSVQFNGSGTVRVEDAILHANGSGITIAPSLTFSIAHQNAVIDGDGPVNSQGTLIWDRGTCRGTGELKVSGSLLFSGDHLKVLRGKRLLNQNVITINGNSTIHLEEFAEIVNEAGAAFNIEGNPTINFLGAPGGSIQNAGTIHRNSGTGTTNIAAEFHNSGLTEIHSGTLAFSGIATNDVGGEIRGTGTLNLLLATFTNHGNISPGTSIGDLVVAGNYSQDSDGQLTIELEGYAPGTEYDRLLVSGNAHLNGILNISLAGNFTPALGSQFTIINSLHRYGQFSQVVGPTISGQPVFEISYDTNKVVLTVVRQSLVLTAVNDYAETDEDMGVEINVLRNDNASEGNNLSISGFTQPAHGVAAQIGDSTFSYLPVENFFGVDSFFYSITDQSNAEDSARVRIIVLPVNDPPQITTPLPDISFPEDSSHVLDLAPFANDVDDIITELNWSAIVISAQFPGLNLHPGGKAFTSGSKSGVSGIEVDPGDLQINIDPLTHLATFTATGDTSGIFAVGFTVSDPGGLFDSDTITVTVLPVNDPPAISGLPASLAFDNDTSAAINIWEFVDDVETADSLLTYEFVISNDSLLSGYNSQNGSLLLSAIPGFSGEVSLLIRATDLENASVEDTLIVIVNPVITVGIANGLPGQIPQEFALQQNFPNPFNPNTTIKFQIPEAGEVRLAVYNILGQKVRILMNERLNAGYYQVTWDGLNEGGQQMASGIYIYRIEAGNFLMVRKMTLMK